MSSVRSDDDTGFHRVVRVESQLQVFGRLFDADASMTEVNGCDISGRLQQDPLELVSQYHSEVVVRNRELAVIAHEFMAIPELQRQPAAWNHQRLQRFEQAESFKHAQSIAVNDDATARRRRCRDAFENGRLQAMLSGGNGGSQAGRARTDDRQTLSRRVECHAGYSGSRRPQRMSAKAVMPVGADEYAS